MDNTIKNIDDYAEKLILINEKAKKEKGRVGYFLSKNIPFRIGVAAGSAIGLPFLVDFLLPGYALYSVIPFGVAGFFTPRIIHSICLHSNGKMGLKYAKNKLADYVDVVYKYNLICMSKVLNCEVSKDLPAEDYKKFVEQTKTTAEIYKQKLDELVGKRISKRVSKDFEKIERLLKNESKNHNKIQRIIENNKKYIEPWVDAYNECGENAKFFATYACKFNPELKMPKDNAYYADIDILAKKVNKKMEKLGLKPTQEFVDFDESHEERLEQIKNRNAKKFDKDDDLTNIF